MCNIEFLGEKRFPTKEKGKHNTPTKNVVQISIKEFENVPIHHTLKRNITRTFYKVFSLILTYFKGQLKLAIKAEKDYIEDMKVIKKLAFHVGTLTTYIVWFTRVRCQMIAERRR